MAKYTEQDLLNLKKKIDDAKKTASELTGHKNALMKQLADEWECNTIEEAEKKLQRMEKDIQTLNSQFEKGRDELDEKMKENAENDKANSEFIKRKLKEQGF